MSVGLSLESCRERQGRLRKLLATENLNAALITDPRHVYYFSGYWSVGRALKPSALLIEVEGRSTLACPGSPESSLAAEEIISYSADHLGTLLDDPDSELWSALESRVKQEWTIGADRLPLEFRLDHSRVRPLLGQLFTLRRTKHSDEVAMLQAGIGGCDAAYTRAR